MTDAREQLVELIAQKVCDIWSEACDERIPPDCGKCYANNCRIAEVANHLIANGVTIQRWIPVTERLPEDDLPKGSKAKRIKVQVAYRTNGNWVVRTQVRAKGYWYGEPDKWDWIKERDPITHWMPLPEPPKGE